MIKIIDDVFTENENQLFYDRFINLGYHYGEIDDPTYPPTGLVSKNFNIDEDSFINEIYNKIDSIVKNNTTETLSLGRIYINLFLPGDVPYYHQDNTAYTVMLYILHPLNKLSIDNGETLYLNPDNLTVVGVLPKPGRVVIHDGKILHRATSCRVYPRLSLVFRFNYK